MIKKVKFVASLEKGQRTGLTPNKVYDVLDYNTVNKKEIINNIVHNIEIVNDYGSRWVYYMVSDGMDLFIDVTREYRNELIDGILN